VNRLLSYGKECMHSVDMNGASGIVLRLSLCWQFFAATLCEHDVLGMWHTLP
jgi:hypothetical protein